MPDRKSFDYAVIRIVPNVERQEFINVGVILFARTLDFLDAKIDMSSVERLSVFPGKKNFELIRKQLKHYLAVCHGDDHVDYFSKISKSERFNWLVAPSSTIIQTSPVHTGISNDPVKSLEELFDIV